MAHPLLGIAELALPITMSEHYIKLISKNPRFVPAADRLEKAKLRFTQFLPDAQEIQAFVSDEIKFVDQGENFERVSCPKCGSELETLWWQQAMEKSWESKFQQMEVITPCCQSGTTLNDLDYQFPAGFARCQLSARDANQKEISPDQKSELEQILGTPLHQILVHY